MDVEGTWNILLELQNDIDGIDCNDDDAQDQLMLIARKIIDFLESQYKAGNLPASARTSIDEKVSKILGRNRVQ